MGKGKKYRKKLKILLMLNQVGWDDAIAYNKWASSSL
jgi:hypothetical protein